MGERKEETRQLANGKWQSRYSDGAPNEYSFGDTEQEALNMLRGAPIQAQAITVTKLAHPVTINGALASFSAYRDADPSFQGYGIDANSARVDFLHKERAKNGGKPAEVHVGVVDTIKPIEQQIEVP